jgi:phenylacetate-coenzyme A ligase PaaK-like adenylate-forming protein
VRVAGSIRYATPDAWQALLRTRALAVPRTHDRAALLRAFAAHSPFYAARLAGISDWEAVPPLTKAEVAAVPVTRSGTMYDTRSSGTSGQQVLIQNSQPECRFRQALAYRPLLFSELDAEVRQLMFVDGTAVDRCDKPQFPFPYGGRRYLTWRVGCGADPAAVLRLLRALRPQLIRGLCSGIVRFVDAVGCSGLADSGVQLVSPSGETLLPAWRARLEAAFAARVLDRYGATETGAIGWQCPHCQQYHANTDEILLEASPTGLLATPLFIETQPLLRYALGDEVTLHPAVADCPVRLPTLQIRAARRDDWLVDGAGAKVSPLSFQFERIAGLQAWRIYQDATGAVTVYVDAEPGSTAAAEVRAQLARRLPGREVVCLRGVSRLQLAGKYKRVASALRVD